MRTRSNDVIADEPPQRKRVVNNYFKICRPGAKGQEAEFAFFDDASPEDAESAYEAAKFESERLKHRAAISIFRRPRWTIRFNAGLVTVLAAVPVIGELSLSSVLEGMSPAAQGTA